ncbi:hypothetical protein TrispH2_010000 [Trichoplax sp. H2]|nr:hypothetical protein TrispH2_010000 [Trichoplax sp. H2]|eukprot:RDD37433.1 hypothetical protein TrispH2_010000 [Trichoplax sp. H2]
MTKHILENCSAVPSEIKQYHNIKYNKSADSDMECTALNNAEYLASANPLSAPPALGKKRKISDYGMAKPTNLEHTALYSSLVLALITSDIPWKFLDNGYFREFQMRLHPDFQPLSGYQACEQIVNKLQLQTDEDITNFLLDSTYLTISCDATNSVDNWNITNWVATNENAYSELIYITSRPCAKTAPDIFEEIYSFIARLKLPLSTQVSFCSDSSDIDAAVKKKVREQPDARIGLTGSCLAHQSNFIMKDVIRNLTYLGNSIGTCQKIARFTHQSKSFYGLLRDELDIQDISIWIPTQAQWYSIAMCVKQILCIEKELKVASGKCSDDAFMPFDTPESNLQSIINDDHFWSDLKSTYAILTPFNFIAAMSERSDITSSQFLITWMWLLCLLNNAPEVDNTIRINIFNNIEKRIQNFIEDHQIISIVLDPRIYLTGLSQFGKRRVRSLFSQFVERLYPQVDIALIMEQYIAYCHKRFPFDDKITWNHMAKAPITFWNEYSQETSELSTVAITIITFTPHASTCERAWSAYATIPNTKQHNRLNFENITKICKIKHHYDTQKIINATAAGAKRYALILCNMVKIKREHLLGNEEDRPDETPTTEAIQDMNDNLSDSEDANFIRAIAEVADPEFRDDLPSNSGMSCNRSVDVQAPEDITMKDFTLSWLDLTAQTLDNIEEIVRSFVPIVPR